MFDILRLFLKKAMVRLSLHFLLRQSLNAMLVAKFYLSWPPLHNSSYLELASSYPVTGAYPGNVEYLNARSRSDGGFKTHQ